MARIKNYFKEISIWQCLFFTEGFAALLVNIQIVFLRILPISPSLEGLWS
jgi:hypothetical protein